MVIPEERSSLIVAQIKDLQEKERMQYLPENLLDPSTKLPSKGRTYPDITLSYFPYTYGELLRYNSSDTSEEEMINMVLKGIKSSATTFSIKELTYWDFIYIGLLRNLSRGDLETLNISFLCTYCKERNTVAVPLPTIDFIELTMDDLPIIVTINKEELHFSPLTINDYIELCIDNKANNPLYLFAKTVRNIPLDKVLKIIDTAFGEDEEVLDYIDTLMYHGPKPIEIQCPNKKCNHLCTLDLLDREGTLIRPFRGSKFSPKDRVRFGK